MSVINQMLKDLEERNQPASEVPAGTPIIVNQPPKSTSSIVIVLVSVVLSMLIAGAVWLYLENQKLQLNQKDVKQSASQGDVTATAVNNNSSASQAANGQVPIKKESSKQETSKQAQVQASAAKVNSPERVTSQKTMLNEPESNLAESIGEVVGDVESTFVETNIITTPKQPIVNNVTDKPVTEIPTPSASIESSKTESKPSLSIARKQLSPEQLAAQKMSQVDKAMMEGEGQKAEQLLQDVVLLTPMNTEARKQLAALWFAQGQLQGALNVLNQGVAAMPDFADFRLMKAKILLQQNNTQGAYQSLIALPMHPQIEYQLLLAQASQQVGELSASINAYRQLVLLQPSKGKWYLGLAIALDRNSQFGEAVKAYREAIALGDISPQSRQFAQQRMAELGD